MPNENAKDKEANTKASDVKTLERSSYKSDKTDVQGKPAGKTDAKTLDYQMAPPGPDTYISYPSAGPILSPHTKSIQNNGHSVLTDVAGREVWLRDDLSSHAGGRVHMPLSHARDMGLPTPSDVEEAPVAQGLSPGAQPAEPTADELQMPQTEWPDKPKK